MKHIAIECEDLEEAFGTLFSFIDDVYTYLGIELPDVFDSDEELIRIVQAVEDAKNGIQKPKT